MEMIKSRYMALILLALPAMRSQAQYDQNISVEGKYVPEFIAQDRIGLFPRPVKFPMETSSLTYSLTGVHADFTPEAVAMPATGWRATRHAASARGYVDLGLGSWLEGTLSAGYRIIDTRESALGIRLQHNSTSLWKPNLSEAMADTKMWRYDESLGIYGHHTFDGKGRLDAAIDYHIGNFNYYGYDPAAAASPAANTYLSADAPTQTLNDVAARIGWHSPSGGDNIAWNIGAGVRYFGLRRMYTPGTATPDATTGGRETRVDLQGGVAFPTSTKSRLGIDLDASLLTYGKYEARSGQVTASLPAAPDTYGMVSLTPYYRFTRSRLAIRIGARVDLAFNAGPEDNRYSTFHIAPSVKLDFNAGPMTLYLHANGGSSLHTLAGCHEADYYSQPALYMTKPVYTPLDARLGVAFGPFSGFHAGADIAYRTSRGEYLGGWYQTALNGYAVADGLPAAIDNRAVIYDYSADCRSNISGFSIGVNAGYDAGRYFRIEAEGRYQNQDGKTGFFNGYDRPEWTAAVTAETNPWSTLRLKVGYDLRAMRMMPVQARFADTTPLNGSFLVTHRLPNVSMLNFGVSYGITRDFDIWAQADNLLCRRQVYLPGLPEPRLRLSAGIGLRF